MCNYLRFHNDVCQLDCTTLTTAGNALYSSSTADNNGQSSLQQILSKISNVVFKNGIRTTEFFKDHDKLNSGVITENQVQLQYHNVLIITVFSIL